MEKNNEILKYEKTNLEKRILVNYDIDDFLAYT